MIRIKKKLCYVKQPKLTKFCPSAQCRTPRRVYYLWGPDGLRLRLYSLMARIKISVNIDILVLRFYGYIGNIREISMNIMTKIYETKIIQNSQKCLKKLKKI